MPQDGTSRSVADAVVSGCNAVGYDSFAASGGRSHLPRSMVVDVSRKKRKQVYEGEIQASSSYRLRLKLSVVNLEDKDGRRTEITGTMPDIDRTVAEVLSSRGGDSDGGDRGSDGGWASDCLTALSEFLDELNTVLLTATR
ncbi:hypothetical protein GPECTOR_83g294 [Gonium pectorale]|uniref:Uncharacterized protein n=1 Tax=Gonium pectorale TaxID=33097 RepID=A0A150G1D4_GONPE|nr:hypothetical protein GPECTOR_83g294 [Gonium pectorale]|eukprot:KXZ43682.1 hypothetical protein GPECTOR_83g294 [Gonium pectorale]